MNRYLFGLLFFTLSSILFGASNIRTLGSSNGITHFQEELSFPVETASTLNGHFETIIDPTRDPLEGVEIETIINLGQKIWKLIEAGQPVINVKFDYANALPRGVTSSEDLDSFSPLQMKSYRTYGTNLYGITVYDVTYTAVHRFGGSYNGQGHYLENVTILPQKVEVLWGYTLNMNVSRVSTVNVGTKTDPVGSVLMELDMDVSTVLKTSQTRQLVEFRGDSKDIATTILK